DVGVLNPAKPFFPFGPVPKVGSKFFVGHPEAFNKHLKNVAALDSLTLRLTWADLPTSSFPTHYAHYTQSSQVTNDNAFTIDVEVLENGDWRSVDSNIPLFVSNTNANVAPSSTLQIDLSDLLTSRAPDGEVFSNLTPLLQRGFVRFRLNRNFLHKNYPTSITAAVAADPSTTIPNEPYTPTISEIKMTYRSSKTVDYRDAHSGTFADCYEQLFHIEPFGWKEIYPIPNSDSTEDYVVTPKLLPEFKVSEAIDESHPDLMTTDAEGTLYIGLKELVPEQNVSILFQVAEGSADPEKNTQQVFWSYLANNQWIDFDRSEILADATNGLLNSGIITFVMTKAMTAINTSHPANTFWIKASVARQTTAINQMIAVMPQAVKATFAKQEGNDLDRLSDALPAATIAKLKNRQAAFKSVLQPFASFNGKVAETDEAPEGVSGAEVFNKNHNEFYIRISERLRHKNRGITIWDYERLVLQKFPEVYKVKCVNHTRSFDGILPASEHAPGNVKVIVMPNLHNQNAVDPLRPMISLAKLEAIKNYLQSLISDFVDLEVKNPQFERIKVTFNVKFLEGKDKGFYLNQLNQDIIKFLSPWIYKEGEDLALGGKIHRSVILNFIEETDYVDYLTDFKMDHIISESKILCDVEEAIASTSSSVIVADQEHDINPDILIECKT
ncbi:MAG: hypothetical protein AAF985_23565, partial [Bacteroidota bacterium]